MYTGPYLAKPQVGKVRKGTMSFKKNVVLDLTEHIPNIQIYYKSWTSKLKCSKH